MSEPLRLPDAVYRALHEVAGANGTTAADWIAARLSEAVAANGPTKDDWVDRDFLKSYSREPDDSVSVEAVRRAMTKIPGRLADDIRAERDAH